MLNYGERCSWNRRRGGQALFEGLPQIQQKTHLRCYINHIIVGLPESCRTQTVPVQPSTNLVTITEDQEGRTIPTLLKPLIVFVERNDLQCRWKFITILLGTKGFRLSTAVHTGCWSGQVKCKPCLTSLAPWPTAVSAALRL